ncbi:hypothetical protein NECAME_09664 [Necator americanus]|uniref:Uncharacterized protein n=1 Tax=Necator americanus TaxID=51031 RepID=W2TCA1_NECAM|nr:hypothetical protein NECAME_09664 [Necator americanus]ETN79680.1 hypothetical protein NECAME_09664 [Necator americanus]
MLAIGHDGSKVLNQLNLVGPEEHLWLLHMVLAHFLTVDQNQNLSMFSRTTRKRCRLSTMPCQISPFDENL